MTKATSSSIEPSEPIKSQIDKGPRRNVPGLLPGRQWQGLCHDVEVRKDDQFMHANSTEIPIEWNFSAMLIPLERRVSVPWPYYQILIRTYQQVTVNGKLLDDVNKIDLYTNPNTKIETVPRRLFTVTDYGPTPGTENLPTGIREWVASIAEEEEYFKHWPKAVLLRYATLVDCPFMKGDRAEIRAMSVDNIREAILETCNFDSAEIIEALSL